MNQSRKDGKTQNNNTANCRQILDERFSTFATQLIYFGVIANKSSKLIENFRSTFLYLALWLIVFKLRLISSTIGNSIIKVPNKWSAKHLAETNMLISSMHCMKTATKYPIGFFQPLFV